MGGGGFGQPGDGVNALATLLEVVFHELDPVTLAEAPLRLDLGIQSTLGPIQQTLLAGGGLTDIP